MSNATNNTFFSWRTNKNTDGTFSFVITKNVSQTEQLPNGRYCTTEIVKTEAGFKTRARAKGRGIQWVRYFKANA